MTQALNPKKTIAIVGGGASALFCACFLDTSKFEVTIYEKNKALGRKFLVAGKGGFNLTHAEELAQLIGRYEPSDFLEQCLTAFTNTDLRNWLASIGIPTYVGSSHRVYPSLGTKPIEVLEALLNRLTQNGVKLAYNQAWTGWNDQNEMVFNTTEVLQTDAVIFGLGGASWKVTGSTGSWLEVFSQKKIKTTPFEASNCAVGMHWDEAFQKQYAGTPLKNIAVRCGTQTQKGELVITDFGLEGNAVYALSSEIRKQLHLSGKASLSLDLKPMLTETRVYEKLRNSSRSISKTLGADLKITPAQLQLLKLTLTKDEFQDMNTLANRLKNLPLIATRLGPMDEAISTVGGLAIDEVDACFELKKLPHHYCIGEMLDWDAPTGGYLLQACASMGVQLARRLNQTLTHGLLF